MPHHPLSPSVTFPVTPEERHASLASEATRLATASGGLALLPDIDACKAATGYDEAPQKALFEAVDIQARVSGPLGVAVTASVAAVLLAAWLWAEVTSDVGVTGAICVLLALSGVSVTLGAFLGRDLRRQRALWRRLRTHVASLREVADLSGRACVMSPSGFDVLTCDENRVMAVAHHAASDVTLVDVSAQDADHLRVRIGYGARELALRWVPRTGRLSDALAALVDERHAPRTA